METKHRQDPNLPGTVSLTFLDVFCFLARLDSSDSKGVLGFANPHLEPTIVKFLIIEFISEWGKSEIVVKLERRTLLLKFACLLVHEYLTIQQISDRRVLPSAA
jgi:hypothetical protein